jgi:hypothetical protein
LHQRREKTLGRRRTAADVRGALEFRGALWLLMPLVETASTKNNSVLSLRHRGSLPPHEEIWNFAPQIGNACT